MQRNSLFVDDNIYIYIYIYIAHEIDKLRLQILEALHIKEKKIHRINFENRDNALKSL